MAAVVSDAAAASNHDTKPPSATAQRNATRDPIKYAVLLAQLAGLLFVFWAFTIESPDFVAMSVNFGCMACPCPGDCTNDCMVTAVDFVALSIDFGKSNGPSGITNPSKGPSCQP